MTCTLQSVVAMPSGSKKSKGSKYQAPRAKSVNSKPSQPQTRTLKNGATSKGLVQKVSSDVSLTSRFCNLSIHDGASSAGSVRSRKSGAVSRREVKCETIEDIARHILVNRCSKIVVMVGAGISTGSGIPDFRTPGTGLYDNLKQYRLPYPQAVFDIDYFEHNPKPFFQLAKELYPSGKYRPNYVHYFLRLLHEKGLLLRVYTQNIDGLERMAGIPAAKLVEAHGSFQTASCTECKLKQPPENVKAAIFNDKIPRCQNRKCWGVVKPDIVFFGEDLPRRFYFYLRDFPQADLLIVMGTSLEVEPFAGIVDAVRFYTPRALFNRKAVGPFERKRRMSDVSVEGDICDHVKNFVRVLGWKKTMEEMVEKWQSEFEAEYGTAGNAHPNKSGAGGSSPAGKGSSPGGEQDTKEQSKEIQGTSQPRQDAASMPEVATENGHKSTRPGNLAGASSNGTCGTSASGLLSRSERIATMGWAGMVRNEPIKLLPSIDKFTPTIGKKNSIDVNSPPFGSSSRIGKKYKSVSAKGNLETSILPDKPKVKYTRRPPKLKHNLRLSDVRASEENSEEETSSDSSSSEDDD